MSCMLYYYTCNREFVAVMGLSSTLNIHELDFFYLFFAERKIKK